MEATAKQVIEAKDLKAVAEENRRMVEEKSGRVCPKCGEKNPVSRMTCAKCHEKLLRPDTDPKPAKSVKTREVSKADRKRIEKREKGKAKEKKAAAKKPAKPSGETKYGKLRAALNSGKEWAPEFLMKASGFDKGNLRVALSILRNTRRTKKENLIDTEWDQEKNKIVLRK